MSNDKNQSAIREVEDQLFLGTADGIRLNNVSSNLGIERPRSGFSDDRWRALIRKVALNPKNIRRAFKHCMDICYGPRTTRTTNLVSDIAAGVQSFLVTDYEEMTQVGTLILDSGQGTQEIIEYCYVDRRTGEVFLNSTTDVAHTAVADGEAILLEDAAVSATSLVLSDSSFLPTTGFPYTTHVGKGLKTGEEVTVSANDTATNTLTVSALTNAHTGFKVGFLRTFLDTPTYIGRTFLELDQGDNKKFPETGWIRIGKGSTFDADQVWQVDDSLSSFVDETTDFNDAGGDDFRPFPGADDIDDYCAIGYSAPFDSIHLDSASGTIGIGGVVSWEYWNGSWTALTGVVDNTDSFKATASDGQIVSWDVPTDWAASVINGSSSLYYIRAVITTTYSTTPAYDQGYIVNPTVEIIEYNGHDFDNNFLLLETPLQYDHAAFESVELMVPGEVVKTAGVVQQGIGWEMLETKSREVQILLPESLAENRILDVSFLHKSQANASSTIASIPAVTDTELELVSTASFPPGGQLINVGGAGDDTFYTSKDDGTNKLILSKPIGTAYAIGTSVGVKLTNYAGTTLPEGNPRDAGGTVEEDLFPGPYIFNDLLNGPSLINTTLQTLIPPPTSVVVGQTTGTTNLEIADAKLWPAAPFSPFNVRVGSGSGFEETVPITDLTPAGTSTTISGAHSPGDTVLDVASSVNFPETSGGYDAGYTLLLDEAGTPETVTVVGNDGATQITLAPPGLAFAKSGGETVELTNDTITTSSFFNREHLSGQLVEILYSQITVADATEFPEGGGCFYLNFGRGTPNVRKKIVNAVSSTVYELTSVAELPSALLPFSVSMGQGLATEEILEVTSIAGSPTNEITLTSSPTTFAEGDYMELITGDSEVIDYQDVDGSDIIFTPERSFSSKHIIGEQVTLSRSASETALSGYSYGFLLPPNRQLCIDFAIDLVRMAGIKITYI